MIDSFPLALLLLLPMLGALLGAVWNFRSIRSRNTFYALVCAVHFAIALLLSIQVAYGAHYTLSFPAFGGLGLQMHTDGFRALYVTVASFMWLATALFGQEYAHKDAAIDRFHICSLLTLGATTGVFLSADLVTTFLFFEWVSLCSYALVAHDKSPKAVAAANIYLGIAIFGSLAMLMGLFLLQHTVGTLVISELAAACAQVADIRSLYIVATLLLLGFGAKAGLFPLHMWLPLAHPAAPAPASALLSGVLTKTGVFGVIVICGDILPGNIPWNVALLGIGLISMLLGAVLALFSSDIKHILACSTISQIGFITLGIAAGSLLGHHNALAVRGTILHMLNHSFAKLVLFTIAGVFYMHEHKLDIFRLRGVGRNKPWLAIPFLGAALNLAGIPPFSGYISKTLLHESLVECLHLFEGQPLHMAFQLAEVLFFVAGGLTLAYMAKLFLVLFVSKPAVKASSPKRYLSLSTNLVLVVCSAAMLLFGLLPHHTVEPLAAWAEAFFHGHDAAHSVEYYALVNLRGAVLSAIVGIGILAAVWRRMHIMADTAVQSNAPSSAQQPWLLELALRLMHQPAAAKASAPKRVAPWADKWHATFAYLYQADFSTVTPKGIAASFSFGLFMLSIGLCITFVWLLWIFGSIGA